MFMLAKFLTLIYTLFYINNHLLYKYIQFLVSTFGIELKINILDANQRTYLRCSGITFSVIFMKYLIIIHLKEFVFFYTL